MEIVKKIDYYLSILYNHNASNTFERTYTHTLLLTSKTTHTHTHTHTLLSSKTTHTMPRRTRTRNPMPLAAFLASATPAPQEQEHHHHAGGGCCGHHHPPADEPEEVDGAASWNTFRWIPDGVLKVVERRRDPSNPRSRDRFTEWQFKRYHGEQKGRDMWNKAVGSALTSYSCHCWGCKNAGRHLEFVSMDDALAHLDQNGFRFVTCKCGDRVWDMRLRAHVKEDHSPTAPTAAAPTAAPAKPAPSSKNQFAGLEDSAEE